MTNCRCCDKYVPLHYILFSYMILHLILSHLYWYPSVPFDIYHKWYTLHSHNYQFSSTLIYLPLQSLYARIWRLNYTALQSNKCPFLIPDRAYIIGMWVLFWWELVSYTVNSHHKSEKDNFKIRHRSLKMINTRYVSAS